MELFVDPLAKAAVPGVFGGLNCNHLNDGVR